MRAAIALSVAVAVAGVSAARAQSADSSVVIFHAASLGPPFRALLTAFRAKGGIASFDHQPSPSLEAVRKLTDLGRTPDILASADRALLDSLVLPRFASWYVVFGTNALVLAYGPKSIGAADLKPDNWWEVLLRKGVRIGRSDPRSDPSGYRTLMAVDLAERHYRQPGLAARLRQAMAERFVYRAEADLSALVQLGELDYIWTYRNLAKAHRLQYLELPKEINLEDPRLESWYSGVGIDLPGSGATKPLHLRGSAIVFALTIPKDAPHPRSAARVVRFLFSAEGRGIMEANGFSMLASPEWVGQGVPEGAR